MKGLLLIAAVLLGVLAEESFAQAPSFIQGDEGRGGTPLVTLVGSHSVSVAVELDGPGRVQYVVLMASDAEPSAAQVVAGEDAIGGMPFACGSVILQPSPNGNYAASISVADMPYEECGTVRQELYYGPDIPGITEEGSSSFYGADLSNETEGLFYGSVLRTWRETPMGRLCAVCPTLQPSTSYILYTVASDSAGLGSRRRLLAVGPVVGVDFFTAGPDGVPEGRTAPLFTFKRVQVDDVTTVELQVRLPPPPPQHMHFTEKVCLGCSGLISLQMETLNQPPPAR